MPTAAPAAPLKPLLSPPWLPLLCTRLRTQRRARRRSRSRCGRIDARQTQQGRGGPFPCVWRSAPGWRHRPPPPAAVANSRISGIDGASIDEGQHKTKGSDHMTTDTTRNTAAKPTTGTGSRPRRHTPTAAAGGWYDQRVIVPLPAPVTCPHCGSSSTCARNGVRYNLRTAMRMENRVCSACHFSFTGARPMTREERQRRGVA